MYETMFVVNNMEDPHVGQTTCTITVVKRERISRLPYRLARGIHQTHLELSRPRRVSSGMIMSELWWGLV